MHTDNQDEPYSMSDATRHLAIYIWDNYIELADAKNVVILGIGDACPGVVQMLSSRGILVVCVFGC